MIQERIYLNKVRLGDTSKRKIFKFLGIFYWIVLGICEGNCAHRSAPERPWVHKVYLHGVKQISEKDLKGKLTTQGKSWVPFSSKHYIEAPFEADVDKQRIETYYKIRGYHSAKVTAVEIKPYKGAKVVDVYFTIDEGLPIHIHQILWEGIEGLSLEEQGKLKAQFLLQPGEILNREKYSKQKDQVLYFLRSHGYAFAEIDWEVEVNRDTHLAKIKLTLTPGPKVVLGQAIVQGTQRTDPKAIAKHAAVPTGALFRPETIEEIQGNLYQLGLFATVRVEAVANNTRSDVADVLITVTEGTFNAAKAGVGFEFESGRIAVPLKAEYTRYNFLGGLRTLKIGGRVGYAWLWSSGRSGPDISVKAEFIQPDLLGADSELRAQLGFDVGIDYAYQYYGPSLSLGLSRAFFHRHFQFSLSYQFRFLSFFNLDPAILQTDPTSAGRWFGYHDPYLLGYFQETAIIDFRNRSIDPNLGVYILLTMEEGGNYAGGEFTYEKFVPEIRGYVPLGSHVTLAGRVMFGQIFSQGDLGSPITQRFYLGGPNSHRGFYYNRLSPVYVKTENRQYYADGQRKDKKGNLLPAAFPIGGDQMFLFQTELRVRITKIYGSWFSIVGFVDGGDVSAPQVSNINGQINYESQVDFTNLHWAAGIGLRYQTVIGTIRFDIGFRLDRISPAEPGCTFGPDPKSCTLNPDGQMRNSDGGTSIIDRFAFHLSLGEAF